MSNCYFQWSLVKSDLPPQVNILTIEPIDQDETQLTVLVRFEHMYDQKEHSKYSKSVSFRLDVRLISFKNTNKRCSFFIQDGLQTTSNHRR